jgi:hypothetical protein
MFAPKPLRPQERVQSAKKASKLKKGKKKAKPVPK